MTQLLVLRLSIFALKVFFKGLYHFLRKLYVNSYYFYNSNFLEKMHRRLDENGNEPRRTDT